MSVQAHFWNRVIFYVLKIEKLNIVIKDEGITFDSFS